MSISHNLPNQNIFDLKSLLPAFHEIRLPSSGKFHGTPEILHVRGMTVKELKHLTASGRIDKTVFDNQIASCIKENIDINSLLLQDYNFIAYSIRLFTTGSKAAAGKICDNPICKSSFNFEYDASEFAKVTYAEDTISPTTSVSLPRFKEEHNLNIMLEIKRLTRKDFLAVDKAIRRSLDDAAKLGQTSKVFPLIEYLKAFIINIEGFPVPVPKEQLLDILTTEEAELITGAFGKEEMGISGEAHPICPICQSENTYVVPFTDLFFQ